jgi:hypothetical protein
MAKMKWLTLAALVVMIPTLRADTDRNSAFIQNHPYTSSFVMKGKTYQLPFRVYDCQFTLLIGLGDIDYIRQQMSGSDVSPVVVIKDGKEYGVVRMYFINYHDSDLAPYHEMVVGYDSVKDGATIPWVNPYSDMLGQFYPNYALFLHRLILDQQEPIDLGRIHFGMDKRMGSVFVTLNPARGTDVTDVTAQTLNVNFAIDKSPAALQAYVQGLEQALGVRQLPPAPSEYHFGEVTRDVNHPAQFKRQADAFSWAPSVNPFTGTLTFNAATSLGRIIKTLNFQPLLVADDPHTQFTMDEVAN